MKLDGAYINTTPALIGIVCFVGISCFKFAKIIGVNVILRVKS